MKFFLSLALLAAAGVSAQTAASPAAPASTSCNAENIVTNCLESQQPKVVACPATDYSCLCAAYQAVQTCWNNCPNDPSAAPAQNQADAYCRNASLYATTSTPTATHSATASSPAQTSASGSGSGTEKTGASKTTSGAFTTGTTATTDNKSGAAAGLVGNTGGVFLAVAGAVAAML